MAERRNFNNWDKKRSPTDGNVVWKKTTSSELWKKGQLSSSQNISYEIQEIIHLLTDPQFLQETSNHPTKLDQFQNLLNKATNLFSRSPNPLQTVNKLLFTPSASLESRAGLLGLSATKSVAGSDAIHVCGLVENIMEKFMINGWFPTIISFRNFHMLQNGRCSLLSREVFEWVTRKGGLLEQINKCSDSALLLLYFFLSIDYEGAFYLWKSLFQLGSECISRLCKSLVNYLFPSNLSSPDQQFSSTASFAFHLLRQIVEVLGWYAPLSSSSGPDSLLSDEVIQCLRTFSSKFALSPSLPLFLVPKNVLNDSSDNSIQHSPPQLSLWEERFMNLERLVYEEKQKNERVEAQLQQTLSIISSLQSTVSDFSKIASAGPIMGNLVQSPVAVPNQTQSAPSSPTKLSEKSFEIPVEEEKKEESPLPEENDVKKIELSGEYNLGEGWVGFSHPNCASPDSFALLQKADGNYTIINKKPGRGNISFSVGNVPQVVIDAQGNMGIGTTTPRSKLHVEGSIKCGQSSFAVLALESLTVVRGGFSCRTAEPKKGPGWQLFTFENGIFEIRFDHPFAKRPSVIAIQNVPQETPSLIALGFVDQAKFGFVKVAAKAEVWVEFFVFGQRAAGWL